MPICRMTKQECHVTLNSERLFGTATSVKRQKVLKLHRQMCQASSEKLKRLLKNAGCNNSDVINLADGCVENCEFCRK